jgi:hypothetical protein
MDLAQWANRSRDDATARTWQWGLPQQSMLTDAPSHATSLVGTPVNTEAFEFT